ncbi:transcriptional regulator FtrA [Tistrella mobilis]|uniref:transcriptional regulator FtrA n=1 Tax=Tistrella mobilis TaxID=171437 RepID=UPI003557473D
MPQIPPDQNRPADQLDRRLVVVLVYDGLCTFEFGIAVEVFGLPRPEAGPDWYRFAVVAAEPGPLSATGGIKVHTDAGLEMLSSAGTIIIPGWRDPDEAPPALLLEALREAHGLGARILSICSGVFVLAASGLLANRRVTTHWRYAERLAERYPTLRIEPDVLYVDEGEILTSAGSSAGLDLALHLVRRDFGPAMANKVARRLVTPPHRDGGQAQYVESPVSPRGKGRMGRAIDWARSNLHEDIHIDAMAEEAAMSPRTFARRFREATGMSPGDWLARERLARARDLLETSSAPLTDIAEAVGFGSVESLRHQFRIRLSTSPSAYRAHFRQR